MRALIAPSLLNHMASGIMFSLVFFQMITPEYATLPYTDPFDGLIVTNTAQTEITIDIQIDSSSTPAGFTTFEAVCREPAPCPGPFISTGAFTTTNRQIGPLQAGIRYGFEIFSTNGSTTDPNPRTNAVTHRFCTQPAKPQNVEQDTTAFDSTAATLQWTASSVFTHIPKYGTAADSPETGLSTSLFQFSPLTPATCETAYVRAVFQCLNAPTYLTNYKVEGASAYARLCTAPADAATLTTSDITSTSITTSLGVTMGPTSDVTFTIVYEKTGDASSAVTVTSQTGATYIMEPLESCQSYDHTVTPVLEKTSPTVNIPGGSATKSGTWTKPNKVTTTTIAQSAVTTNTMTLDGFSTSDIWEEIEIAVSSSETGCDATPTATLLVSASPLEVQITGLNQGCEWAIVLKAKCGAEYSETAHNIVNFCTQPETPVPTQDEATTTTTAGGFQWTANTPAADKYFVENPTGAAPTEVTGVSSGTVTLAARTCAGISFYAQTACTGDTPYTINGDKQTLNICPLPPEPTVTQVADEEKLTLTFAVSPAGSATYEVCWKPASSSYPCTLIAPATSPHELLSLTSCTKYDYTVFAVENSLKSNSSTFEDQYTLPKPIVSGTSQSAESTTGFTIDGIAVTSGRYEGVKATITGTNPTAKCPLPSTTVYTESTAATSLTIASGLSAGCEYTIDLESTCDSGTAEAKTATTVTLCTLPDKPITLTQTESTATSVTFTWDDPISVTPDGYQAKLSTSSTWNDVPAGMKEFQITTGLTPGASATVEVRSKLDCPNSDSDTLYSAAETLSVLTSITLAGGQPYHSLLLPYGPRHGDFFNRRSWTCNEKPFPLEINFAYGKKLLNHVFICKGGFVAFSNGQSDDMKTTDLMAVFWTEDVNFQHWKNPFFDYLCLQIYDYYNSESDEAEKIWGNLGVDFLSYFAYEDIIYGDICQKKEGEMPVTVEELIKVDDPRMMQWVNEKYDITKPSASISKDILLTGNIFKRVDRSPDTLNFVTSLIRKLPSTENFEATWSFVVTWLRMALSFYWKGWLSQQTVIACDENSSGDAFSRACFIIWHYEAGLSSPCDYCEVDRTPLDVGFNIDGVHYPFPQELNGTINVSGLVRGSNVGHPGLYIFNFTGGMPVETQYSGIKGWFCEREVTPDQCHLYTNNYEILTLKGFFCDSASPEESEIEIVFQGAYTTKKMRPLRVDRITGDIEVFCPFWGVVERAAGYLQINGKEKSRSTFQILFGTYLDTYGFPPYALVDALEMQNIEQGLPEDFEFKSDNLLVRSVALKGFHDEASVADVSYLSQVVKMLVNNSIAVVEVTSDVNINYKAVIMQKDFKEMPIQEDERVVQLPVIMKRNISCETWIEEQEKINISHCYKRFQKSNCSSNLCVDYSCPTSGWDFVLETKTLGSLAWREDICCSLSGNSKDHFATSGLCNHCELTQGASFCFYTIPFPCRDSQDTSKELFHISHKCCYENIFNSYSLITDYKQGAGGLSLYPNVRHDFARHYKSEIEPWRACCGENEYQRFNGENSCEAYHRLRPFLESNSNSN